MSELEDVIFTAKTIKDSLLSDWDDNQCFIDKDKFDSKGLMSETIGMTTLLLLGVAFQGESRFTDEGDIAKLNAIVNKGLNYICDEVESKGYTAEPLVSADRTSDIFSDGKGYTDTATWVLSTMVLLRYAQRRKIIGLVKEDQERVFTHIVKALDAILGSQREDGTWGFMTDAGSKRSLYYTYACSGAIADFFDYILGEIALVDDNANFEYKDTELIDYINDKLGYDVGDHATNVRGKTAKWLVETCLPRLPNISECMDLSTEDMAAIGVWSQDVNLGDKYYENVSFIDLYYVYYIIDMMTLTFADSVFKDIVSKDSTLSEFSDNCNGLLPPLEHMFFFKNSTPDDLYEQFYKGYMEQAIHSARNNFLIASRTGNMFWSSFESELVLQWEHEDQNINSLVKTALSTKRGKIVISEPALLPMALRVNTCFCYYISEEKDFSLKRLYSMILSSIASETSGDCKKGLWDTTSYNLAITERSVEAIVDYYDYLCKFDSGDVPVQVASTPIESSEIDNAIRRVVDERIREIMGEAPACTDVANPGCSLTQEAFERMAEDYVNHLLTKISGTTDIYDMSKADDILFKILMAHKALDGHKILMVMKDQVEAEGQEYNPNDSLEQLNAMVLRKDKLVKRLMEDTSDSTADFESIYERVRMK